MKYKSLSSGLDKYEADDDYFYIKGYASVFENEDGNGEVVKKGAYEKSLLTQDVAFLWQHNQTEPIGKIDKIYEDSKGLYIEARLPKADDFVRNRIIPQIKIGALNSLSVGYKRIKTNFKRQPDNKIVLELTELLLKEVSLITIPANAKANFQYKSIATDLETQDIGKVEKQPDWCHEKCRTDVINYIVDNNIQESEYRNYFLTQNTKKGEGLESYEMPIVEIVDQKPNLSESSLYHWALEVKNKSNFENDEKEKIEHTLSKKFDQFGEKNPIKKNFVEYIEDFKSVKDFSNFLKAHNFSSKETNAFIGCLKKVNQIKTDEVESSKSSIISEQQDILEKLKQLKELC